MWAQFLIIAYLSVGGFALTVDDCPSGLERDSHLKVHGEYCYRFATDEKKTFQNAQDSCKKDGGDLVTVNSESFNEYLVDTLKHSYSLYYGPVWIGLRSDSHSFSWVDGSKLYYHNLNANDDQLVADRCVALNPGEDSWSLYRCSGWTFFEQENRYICEYHVTKPSSTGVCPVRGSNLDDVKSLGDKCYYFGAKASRTFKDAEQYCETYGGQLALVKSKEVNDFLFHHISVTHKLKYESQSPWIGLRYTGSPLALHWIDGTTVRYNNMNKYAAAYGHCITISPTDGEWRSHYCTDYSIDKRHFICEFNMKSTLVTPKTPTNPKTTARPVVKTTQARILPTIPTKKPATGGKNHRCPVGGAEPDDVKVLDNKCYYFVLNKKLSFQQAETYCEKDGGTLALPKTPKIDEFLQHHLHYTHGLGYKSEPLWIGLKYSGTYYTYRWIDDSSSLHYTNFEAGYNHEGECVAISGIDGEWIKQYCSKSYSAAKNFICEYNEMH